MKVLCDRDRLREGLALVNGVIPTKATRPAIENVLMVATDDALELVGTDLEVALRWRIEDVKVIEPGTALAPGRVTSDFVRDLTGETVELERDGDSLTITSGSDRCQLPTVDPDEYPVIAHFDPAGALSLQAGSFTKLIGRTAFAAAREQGRYAMHGILTLVEDGTLRMVGTDGRRLAVASNPIDSDSGPPRKAIVPTKGMQTFVRVLSDPLEQVHLQFGGNQLGLKTRRAEVFARLIEGDFPRYAAVIPSETAHMVETDAEVLSRKLRLVANVTTSDARAVRLGVHADRITLHGRSTSAGQATAELEAQARGTEAEITFNPDFLLEGLKNCETDRVRLEFNERTSPGKFTLGENYVYIVMPITVEV
jgi:DNA polymerase III subunit beta